MAELRSEKVSYSHMKGGEYREERENISVGPIDKRVECNSRNSNKQECNREYGRS